MFGKTKLELYNRLWHHICVYFIHHIWLILFPKVCLFLHQIVVSALIFLCLLLVWSYWWIYFSFLLTSCRRPLVKDENIFCYKKNCVLFSEFWPFNVQSWSVWFPKCTWIQLLSTEIRTDETETERDCFRWDAGHIRAKRSGTG